MALAPSSPRLPSPPPPAEIQMAPNSPSGGPAASLHSTPLEQSLLDASSKRRIHPGTKAADMAAGPPLIPLQELDSAFQLQEHLAALHYHHTAEGTKPINRETALQLAQPPQGIDKTLWLYELCRFLISQCNSLIIGFLFDAPPCSAHTCPEMRASEWQFLCAVHEQPKSCCAIDYCCHTLDWAANVVTDQKLFPSRFVVLSDAHSKNVGVKNLVNVFRRLHRIFAHAWFQHRSVFWSVEGETGLYVFFKTVCDLYDLLPAENYKLPPEAEGLETPPSEPEPEKMVQHILKPTAQPRGNGADEDSSHHAGRTNTRRHIRSSPSTGSAVTTVIEADEEETDKMARKAKDLHILAPETVAEEPEVAEVPVMVEHSVIEKPVVEITPDESDSDDVSDADQTVVEDDGEEDDEDEEEEKPKAKEEESSTTDDEEESLAKEKKSDENNTDTDESSDEDEKSGATDETSASANAKTEAAAKESTNKKSLDEDEGGDTKETAGTEDN
ncbi:unnamed protein product [Clonostachys byssicola]|uniref:MOB kinase activator-like 4 n=1 Tax=Clonostachys byssicola TaxID=160290 RepID=A0A9N9UP44_9HYPO|nr:unnamed protein product [Clonostachys byssicola]